MHYSESFVVGEGSALKVSEAQYREETKLETEKIARENDIRSGIEHVEIIGILQAPRSGNNDLVVNFYHETPGTNVLGTSLSTWAV